MPSSVPPLVVALRECHDRLYSFVSGLGQAELEKTSYCDEWSVAQVLSHLGSASQIGLASLQAALGERAQMSKEEKEAIWEDWNAKGPAKQAADSGVASDAFVTALEALEEERLEGLLFEFAPGTALGAPEALRLFLAERALHGWDVEVTLDDSVRLRPEHVELLLGLLPRLVSWFARPGGYDGPARLEVRTSEPAGDYALAVTKEGASFGPSSGASGPARLTLPAEALVRLCYGRLDEGHTPADVSSEGVELAQLRRLFPGS